MPKTEKANHKTESTDKIDLVKKHTLPTAAVT